MRFEVRTTGLVVILLGLAALSTVVFVLGMVAGHQMALESAPSNTQLAGVYKAPVPPAAQASPASQAIASPAAAASPSAPVASATQAAPAKVASRRSAAMPSTARSEALPPPPVAKPAPTVSRPAVARAAPTHAPVLASVAPAQRAVASPVATPQSVPAQAAAAPYHKPYNIQIDAVMDRKNADLMVLRMQELGFHATLVPTDISGKIWWRVRVGPYPTKSEATAAQTRLRQQYEQAYGRGGIVGER